MAEAKFKNFFFEQDATFTINKTMINTDLCTQEDAALQGIEPATHRLASRLIHHLVSVKFEN